MPAKPLIVSLAALAVALPALAQQAAQPQPQPAPEPQLAQPVTNTAEPAASRPARPVSRPIARPTLPGEDSATGELTDVLLPPPPPPVEYPAHARRDPRVVGALDPTGSALGADPWRAASGAFLSTLMRRMDAPVASRWAHIGLRNALLARARAPRHVNPVDWVAERAWLLLRMGEADAAQLLVAGVDTDRFTPKMVQVAVQSALASADPPALCPIESGIRRYDPQIRPLVSAMCSALGGEPESAAAQIDNARRSGRIGGIDLTLAQKVVGAGANTGRSVTIEWEPVDYLTAWRFGLTTATGMVPPDRLLQRATSRMRAFHARAPLLTPQQRLQSAMIATGLGVFSSQSMIDLYSLIYDATDPSDLPDTDAWQVRQAFVGRDREVRLAAIRRLLSKGDTPLEKEAMRALVARAATLVEPDAELERDAPELVSAMFAAGYDRQAARWGSACSQMEDEPGDRCWAMLALGAPDGNGIDMSYGRITSFIGRDSSRNRARSALLVAGLAGLGRINQSSADTLNRRYELGIGRQSSWTRMILAATRLRQPGTVAVLAGTGLQAPSFERLPSNQLFHSVLALNRTGQNFTARMIAAEALSRT